MNVQTIINVCNCPIAQKLAEIAIFFGNIFGGGGTKKFQKFENVIFSFQIFKKNYKNEKLKT